MADSLQQKIIAAMQTQFATITTDNGYNTNLGNKVYRWRIPNKALGGEETPCIIIRDRGVDTEPRIGERIWCEMEVEIEAADRNPRPGNVDLGDSDTHARNKMIPDLYAAIDVQWVVSGSHSAISTIPVRHEFNLIEDGSGVIIQVMLLLKVTFEATFSDMSTLI